MRSFASDNFAGVHPAIFACLGEVNRDHAKAYGDDSYTAAAVEAFKRHFGKDIEVFFVFNGTGANVLALKAITESFHSILCAESSHLNEDECGASEKFIGCKLQTIQTEDGKISERELAPLLHAIGNQHRVQPKVVSIAQSTELGTLYTPSEIASLAAFAHRHGMYLHVDGARIANAAASLQVPLRKLATDAGVDVLSFGGTKNGMMFGEAVVFLNKELAHQFKFIRKQGMQLASKMRFIAAQFEVLLTDELWLRNAAHANAMAQLLATQLQEIPEVKIMRKVEANAIFAQVPSAWIPLLQQRYFFYSRNSEVRWMTAFDTTSEDVETFLEAVRAISSH